MARSERLLELLQVLRRHRRPVSGSLLAEEIGVSLRTLYRDIAALQLQGATIQGEPGVGYVLKPGFMLPPLMFSEEEIEALALGSRWVADRADDRLGLAACNALAKIASVLPKDLRESLDASNLLVAPGSPPVRSLVDLSVVRRTIRSERKLALRYVDGDGVETERVVWPFALGFFERVRVLIAWCELRQDFRHFRTDRIAHLALIDARYPRRRAVLLKAWRQAEGISSPDD
jgi:predicted DNA-binding transcriptional regulator YafY